MDNSNNNARSQLSEKRAKAGRQGGLAPHRCRGRGCRPKKTAETPSVANTQDTGSAQVSQDQANVFSNYNKNLE